MDHPHQPGPIQKAWRSYRNIEVFGGAVVFAVALFLIGFSWLGEQFFAGLHWLLRLITR